MSKVEIRIIERASLPRYIGTNSLEMALCAIERAQSQITYLTMAILCFVLRLQDR